MSLLADKEAGRGPIPLLETLEFWSRQMSDHAMFLSLGLEVPSLKSEADGLHSDWEGFRRRLAEASTAQPAPERVSAAAAEAKKLAATLREFKVRVHGKLMAGEWLGWLFPLFVDHIRRELDWFVASIDRAQAGDERPEAQRRADDACTWLEFMMEHAALTSHLLDPTEADLIGRARRLMVEFGRLHEACSGAMHGLVALSERAGRGLDRYLLTSGIGTQRVRSVIHPVLAAHVVREGQMFLRVLEGLTHEARGAGRGHE